MSEIKGNTKMCIVGLDGIAVRRGEYEAGRT